MNNIAKIREKLGITQRQLAISLGWKQGRIGNYETGIRTPSLKTSRQIVSALNQLGANVVLDDVFPAEN